MGTPIFIIPTPDLETPHFRIRRLRSDEVEAEGPIPSYNIPIAQEGEAEISGRVGAGGAEKPVVGPIAHLVTAPVQKKALSTGLRKLLARIFGKKAKPPRPRGAREAARPRRRARGTQARTPARSQPQRSAPERAAAQRPGKETAPVGPPAQQKEKPESARASRPRRRGRRTRPQSKQQAKPTTKVPAAARPTETAMTDQRETAAAEEMSTEVAVAPRRLEAEAPAPSMGEPQAHITEQANDSGAPVQLASRDEEKAAASGADAQAAAPPVAEPETAKQVSVETPSETKPEPSAPPHGEREPESELIQVETRSRAGANKPG